MNALGRLVVGFASLLPVIALAGTPAEDGGLAIVVSLAPEHADVPVDGRVLVILSTDDAAEPRFQIADGVGTQQIFGIDVEGLVPGHDAIVSTGVLGYPVRDLSFVPAGSYIVQAVLHRYETFQRSDGHRLKLPMDRGEGQRWNLAPGNLYSTPRRVTIDPAQNHTVLVRLDHQIPPIEPAQDTPWVRHLRIQSPSLSEFWGRPMELGAHVLLPAGFDDHPEALYPMAIMHGHYPHDFDGFRVEPPDEDLPEANMEWLRTNCPNGHHPECDAHGYERVRQQAAHDFYRAWTGAEFPRVLVVMIQHPTPFYDDSYAVNSANMGPYGDAITYELLPEIERRFRGLGPWARALYGGSTGGWESLAAQVFYPDEYNGCFSACPDPVDFRAYTIVNLYEHDNAYWSQGPWKRVPRPGSRNNLGEVESTLEAVNRRELVLGTKSRSGDQWDAWQAVFSPVGSDGYPAPIWDKETGVIDQEVADYWRTHYDLRAIMERDWKDLGSRLAGKIHVYTGDMDNFYLNNAVVLLEEFLRKADHPPASAVVEYGDRHEHCWSGDHANPNLISRLTYHQRLIPLMVEHWLATAPPGADTTSWRY